MTRTAPVGPTRSNAERRSIRTAVLGAALAGGLIFGTVACTSSPSGSADAGTQTAAASAADSTASAAAVDSEAAYNGGAASIDLPSAAPTSAVSTAGPAPAPAGGIDQEVADVPVTTNPPVAFDASGDFGGAVTTRLTDIAPIDATAQLPGEIAGSAVAVTVEFDNQSADAIGLDDVTVTLTDGNGNPTSAVSTDPAKPVSGALSAGGKQSGVYVFSTPSDAQKNMVVSVSYSTGVPTVEFTGSL